MPTFLVGYVLRGIPIAAPEIIFWYVDNKYVRVKCVCVCIGIPWLWKTLMKSHFRFEKKEISITHPGIQSVTMRATKALKTEKITKERFLWDSCCYFNFYHFKTFTAQFIRHLYWHWVLEADLKISISVSRFVFFIILSSYHIHHQRYCFGYFCLE